MRLLECSILTCHIVHFQSIDRYFDSTISHNCIFNRGLNFGLFFEPSGFHKTQESQEPGSQNRRKKNQEQGFQEPGSHQNPRTQVKEKPTVHRIWASFKKIEILTRLTVFSSLFSVFLAKSLKKYKLLIYFILIDDSSNIVSPFIEPRVPGQQKKRYRNRVPRTRVLKKLSFPKRNPGF